MAKNRLVNTKFWTDTYVIDYLNPIDKLLFLYLITNPYTDISGVYELPLRLMAVETGIDRENIEKVIMPRFERDGKILYRDGWIAIKNFQKHQIINPKVKKGMDVGLLKAPLELRVFIENDRENIDYDSLSHSNLNLNTNTNAETAPTDPVDLELATLLRDKIIENVPTLKEPNLVLWARQVRLMRERDGRTPEQIRYLIIWSQADPFWQANILSTKKLREKFDTLVAQVKRKVNTETLKKSNVAFV